MNLQLLGRAFTSIIPFEPLQIMQCGDGKMFILWRYKLSWTMWSLMTTTEADPGSLGTREVFQDLSSSDATFQKSLTFWCIEKFSWVGMKRALCKLSDVSAFFANKSAYLDSIMCWETLKKYWIFNIGLQICILPLQLMANWLQFGQ